MSTVGVVFSVAADADDALGAAGVLKAQDVICRV
jgi:hypothetical protein